MAALQISKGELVKLAKKAEGLQSRAKKAMEKADEAIEKVVRTAEIGASAFGFGLIQGRYGSIEVVGVPIDLASGLGLHVLGFMGVGGAMGSHLHSLADGAIASYAVTMGRGAGVTWKEKALTPSTAKTSGDRLTDSEMSALAG